jgi:hypothetical protein
MRKPMKRLRSTTSISTFAHRFDDIAAPGAGIHTFFGLDNATDIRFSFDYGITDRLQAGVGRSKGIDPYNQLYDANIKYRLLRQTTDNKMPLSLTLYGLAGITGRPASTDSTSDASFQNTSQRMSYVVQTIVARKFSQSFSLELVPTWTHRIMFLLMMRMTCFRLDRRKNEDHEALCNHCRLLPQFL